MRVVMSAMTLALPSVAKAQVNVEQLRGDLARVPAKAQLEGSFTARAGNVESVVAGAAAIGAARVGRHGFFGSSHIDYARFNRATTLSKSFVHLRYEHRLVDWLYPEGFVQQQQDKFQRLQLRELVGIGLRFILADSDDVRIAYGTSSMFEYERISVPERALDDPESVALRASNYLTATWLMDSRTRLLGTVYIQPRIAEPDDVRLLFESALSTRLGQRFEVTVLVTLRYDSAPPTLVKAIDAEVKNALVLRF
jgi:hypothetical protein